MRLLVSVAIVAHLAVSYAFQSGCLPLRSNQVLRSNLRAKSCDVKMAAMVNVKVQEKTGVKSFSCEKFVPHLLCSFTLLFQILLPDRKILREEVLRTAMLENNVELYYTMKGDARNLGDIQYASLSCRVFIFIAPYL